MSRKFPISRRNLLKTAGVAGAGLAIRLDAPQLFEGAAASVAVPQTALPGSSVAQFVTPLPTFYGRRVGTSSLQVGMYEFQQKVLPDSVYASLPAPFNKGTYLWGYGVGAPGAAPLWPGVTVEAHKGTATTITYVNNLPLNSVLRPYLTYDQTIHWADPLNAGHTTALYTGPIPTVVHLHGGEDQSTSDGVPEGWFTNNGLHGKGYATYHPTAPNAAVYNYPNGQQATTLWFHDHSLGITRINVYSGMAAFYLIRDQFDTGLASNPLRLPAAQYEVEMVIQDRQFDTNGQLYFPDSDADPSLVDGPPSNPNIHPYWIPEFFGDTVCVNGRTWPYLKVEPRRYRFRFLNGSNARFYRMGLVDAASGATGPAMYQIGSDGGLFDKPVKLLGQPEPVSDGTPTPTTRLFLAPSERADVIIDFSGMAGKSFTITNDGQTPYPSGSPLDPSDPTTVVMQFQVTLPLNGSDTTYNPASGAPLRGGVNQEPKIVRLATGTGGIAAGVTPFAKRQLVLFEMEAPFGNNGNAAGTPVIDVINNTKWNGRRDGGGNTPIPGSGSDQFGQGLYITELPKIGSTEVWEFANLTVDAHPIHIHLIQFQLINRQALIINPDTGDTTYMDNAYAGSFPGGVFNGEAADGSWSPITYAPGTIIPGYGPPFNYFNPNADGAMGGNPAFSPYLSGPVIAPMPNEIGWKDTIKVFPGYVNRFILRWAPQATLVGGVSVGQNLFSFDPTVGPAYMLHCHILDHEDNEMMRPYIPVH
jgi:FtsP/CotA-like multicopper oxidase with cupredoxin domain